MMKKMKISFISLGCDKNLVDSEKMLAMMNDSGYEVTDIIADAEAVIINTCCFIHDAKQESIDTIIETAGYKKTGRLKYLIVTGCLATRYHDEISEYLPEVDAILSSSAADELDSCLKKLSGKGLESKSIIKDINRDPDLGKKRLHNNLKNYAYIKIGEGCSKHCTYCVIPSIKGEYRSFPFEDIISEARDAVEKGKNELILIAQETTVYGTDLYGRKRLSELLYALNDIEGLEWIRLMYCYPEEIDDELINAIRDIDKVCKYIDMPIQHISDSILKRMGRKTTGDDIRKLIVKLRREIPGIAIRTSLITGFPGETEEDHTELLEFIKEYRLDRVGVFTYSKEENTPAARFKPVVLKKIKEKRRKELMLAQQEIVFEENEKLYGKVLKAVAEGYLPEEKVYVARTYRDAPDVDGCCFVSSDRDIVLGTVTDVKINGAAGYDLTAEEVI
jgi:ribosomal protein S12 methylthiotransferase